MKTAWWKVNGSITRYTPGMSANKSGERGWKPSQKLAIL